MPTQSERTESTRGKILGVARELFARDGYAQASLAEIVALADVTTGAIYHHFGGKKVLFIAVAEQLEQQIVDEAAASAKTSGSLWSRFESNILNTMEICARPDIQRIIFRDAPTVVGFFEWREIEIKYGFGLMQKAVALLAENEIINAPNPNLTAHIILGAIMEAAHFAATTEKKSRALQQAKSIVLAMLRSLQVKEDN